MQQPKFYEDNKYWLMDEVKRFLKSNQEQVREQKRRVQVDEAFRAKREREEQERKVASEHEGLEVE